MRMREELLFWVWWNRNILHLVFLPGVFRLRLRVICVDFILVSLLMVHYTTKEKYDGNKALQTELQSADSGKKAT